MFTAVFTRRENCEIRVLYLYRKQASNVNDLFNSLNHITNFYTIDLILRDFNINYGRISLIRTPKGQSKVSILERCPLYRGHEYYVTLTAPF